MSDLERLAHRRRGRCDGHHINVESGCGCDRHHSFLRRMLVHLYSSDPLSFSEDRHQKGHHHCFGCRGAALHTSHWYGKRADQLTLTLCIRAQRARSAGLVTTAHHAPLLRTAKSYFGLSSELNRRGFDYDQALLMDVGSRFSRFRSDVVLHRRYQSCGLDHMHQQWGYCLECGGFGGQPGLAPRPQAPAKGHAPGTCGHNAPARVVSKHSH